jgi:hypothetical protein
MPKYSNGRLRVGSMECEKMKKALALALVISMAIVGTMFAQAAPDHIPGPNPEAPGQQPLNPGHADPVGHDGAPGQTGDNPGIGNEPKGE